MKDHATHNHEATGATAQGSGCGDTKSQPVAIGGRACQVSHQDSKPTQELPPASGEGTGDGGGNVSNSMFPAQPAEPEGWDDDQPDEFYFDPCGDCDLPDACEDFGCAIKQGLRTPNIF